MGYRVHGSTDRVPVDATGPLVGSSIWEVFGAVRGRVVDGTPGPIATEKSDLILDLEHLRVLRPAAHHFSLSWSRIQPGGRGRPDRSALDRYDRFVDGLLAAGIAPWITLYHWDLPTELMAEGGWSERDTASRFAEYAEIVGKRLADRAAALLTMSDPWQHTMFGHAAGVDAPGLTLLGGAFDALHHQLLAHGLAVPLLGAAGPAAVGVTVQHAAVRPVSGHAADRRAAALFDAFLNRLVTDPLLRGRYPRVLDSWISARDVVRDGDAAVISVPLDIYGVAHHQPFLVAAAPENRSVPFSLVDPTGPITDGGAADDPGSLTRALVTLHRRYPGLPALVVTESGGAFHDGGSDPGPDAWPDPARIDYLERHLAATVAAREAGVDVRGYFHRSLSDGWEGADGYTQRFGLIRVDPDGTRAPRQSFRHFGSLVARYGGGLASGDTR